MEKKSFVFHFDYIADIPDELRGQWALYIIDYAQSGIEPAFSSWMEQKLWNSIKTKVDSECQEYQKKIANLKQNSRKNLHSIEGRLSDTDKAFSETDNQSSDSDNAISDTEKGFSDTENALSEGVYVNVNVSEYVNVNDNVSEYVGVMSDADKTNQPTSLPLDINSTFTDLGYSLDSNTIHKIRESLFNAGIEPTPTSVKYAYDIVSAKFYGQNSKKQRFTDKSAEEQKKIFVSALLKYPEDIFIGFSEWLDSERERTESAQKRKAENKARQKPPSQCVCGAELIPKGGGFVCFSCRRTFELINGNWEVNE